LRTFLSREEQKGTPAYKISMKYLHKTLFAYSEKRITTFEVYFSQKEYLFDLQVNRPFNAFDIAIIECLKFLQMMKLCD